LRDIRAAAHRLRQDTHQDMRQKRQKLTSASWLRPVCGGFHNLTRFNCAPFFASCRRHRVLTATCLDACRCAAYLRGAERIVLKLLVLKMWFTWWDWIAEQGQVSRCSELGNELPGSTKDGEFLDQLCDYQLLKKDCNSWKWLRYKGNENQQMVDNLLKGRIDQYVRILSDIFFTKNVKVKLSVCLIN
jgi:hypothetical protein